MTFSGLAIAAASAAPAGAAQAAPAELTGVGSYCEGVPSAYSSDCTDSLQRFLPPGTDGPDEDSRPSPDDIDVSNNPHVIHSETGGFAKGPRRHHRLRRGAGMRGLPGRQAHQRPHGAEQAQPADRPQRAEPPQRADAAQPQDSRRVGAASVRPQAAPAQDPQAAPAQDPQQTTNAAPVEDRQQPNGVMSVQDPGQANGAAPAQEPQRGGAQNAKPPVIRVQVRRVGGGHAHHGHHMHHHFSPRYA
ncbi:hypothetical protein [Actinoallomurus soli]|uniref:hypothetical protein n=1 Tax=Actinoallomurus soli TaxID=2952535 RepID=UPI002093A894|nr:hypothetical protein [Actinoallomurus soli]MCO5969983.1 hypothetical protein [Actinoallomurus soli]